MTIQTADLPVLLRPGVDGILLDDNRFPPQSTHLFKKFKSDKNFEIRAEMRGLGPATFTPEGTPIQFQDMGQQSVTTFYHRKYGVGFTITQEAIDDNLYHDQWPRQTKALKSALDEAQETQAASIFNNAFNPAYPLADGQPVCSYTHPINGGFVSNNLGIQQPNEGALENMLILIRKFKTASGIKFDAGTDKVAIPTELEFQMERLLQTPGRTGTANNDINAIHTMRSLPGGYVVNRYFTNPGSFFILTNQKDYLVHYERMPTKSDLYTDNSTTNVNIVAYRRFSYGVDNFRCLAGAQGS
jgi:hypothetical protein